MSKVAHYLQEHLTGEVFASTDARRYFSTDSSVFAITPSIIVYPQNENDVRKAARFAWQLAERGRVIPITARGAGTDQSGAAIGAGIMLVFPSHMNRILELDNKSGIVTVEPGASYGKLQQTLQTHDRFLPAFPASFEYSTIGGAVANNAGGEKSIKYGVTRDYVRGLRVVLANGEVIETTRLSKRDVNKKLGLATFEGEIYRAIDALLEEHYKLIEQSELRVSKNSAGYCLSGIRSKDGSVDLTPLLVGSQGTLGLITEIMLDTEAYNPTKTLIVGNFDSLEDLQAAVLDINTLAEPVSAAEMVDGNLLELVDKINPNLLKEVISKPFPKAVLLVEVDDASERSQKKMTKRVQKIMDRLASSHHVETDLAEQERLWKIRHASAIVAGHTEGNVKALPIMEDGIVPLDRLREYIDGVYDICKRNHLQTALWGHAGDGNLYLQPFLDLSQVGDRQRTFKVIDEYYNLVISLGGSISGEQGDGRLRGPYLERLYGDKVYELFKKIKQIFDPYGTLNPEVKVNVTLDTVKPLLRTSYSLDHLYDHLPRS